ncbi:MAG: EFR1 family ferrodoxin [Bacteroidaceae bacterium]|nr:EFR1 family ferrodoxin [Bacteroidaceae bacterium]
MTYVFSGTGNSQWVANRLQGLVDDDAKVYGMVFPVYAWGIPKIVEEYIQNHLQDILKADYVYAIMTCGDDIGHADEVLSKQLEGRLDAVFSVHMPNTYVCLPGFDVDKAEVAEAKVKETIQRLPTIAESINRRERRTEVTRGKWAWLKTQVLRPLFNKFLINDKYFYTNRYCSHCKRCVRGCPLNNITMDEDGKVGWKHEHCTMCLRCYHRCPNNAVQFGKFTKKKGQKIHDFDR